MNAADAGISPKTLRTARDRLGVEKMREGFGPDGKWWWSLPGDGGRCCPESTLLPTHGDRATTKNEGNNGCDGFDL